MVKRFRSKNRQSFWNRVLSCAALVLYSLAFIAMPVMHVHGCEHDTDACCEHSHSAPTLNSGDVCPICEFAHLTVPYFSIAEPVLVKAKIVCTFAFPDSIAPAVQLTDLPPCRAPPVLS